MIKVIIFDADGVLIHGDRFSNILDKEYGISVEKTLPFFTGPFQDCLVGKADLKESIEPYLKGWDWDKGVDAFLDLWFTTEHTINEDLIKYIQELRTQGILCFVATNNEKYRFSHMLENMGFKDIFDKTYASSHLGEKKPDKIFFQKIFDDLDGVKKDEILFLDDDIENVKSGHDFGIISKIYTSVEDIKTLINDKKLAI